MLNERVGALLFNHNAAMANRSIVPADIAARFEVGEWRNGLAILAAAHAQEWSDILAVLRGFTLTKSDILKPGGSKGLISSKLDSHFTKLGWVEKKFETKIVVDTTGMPRRHTRSTATRAGWRSKWNGTTRILSSTAI